MQAGRWLRRHVRVVWLSTAVSTTAAVPVAAAWGGCLALLGASRGGWMRCRPVWLWRVRGPKPNVCDSLPRFGASESIFKICHTNPRQNSRNPDHLTSTTCARLHLGRRVCEGGRGRRVGVGWPTSASATVLGPALAAWGGCPARPGASPGA